MRLFLYLSIVFSMMATLIGCAEMGTMMGGPGSNSMHYAVTEDGWKIALKRISGGSGKPPVILCHGLSYNDRFYSLSPSTSLPAYLAQNGYDVWIVSLRGSGSSTKWAYKLVQRGMEGYEIYKSTQEGEGTEQLIGAALGGIKLLSELAQDQLTNVSGNPKYANWVLDDYSFKDVPAVLKYVRNATGQRKVYWVGHSMGGIVMLCYLIKNSDPDIAGLVTVGSQLTMPPGKIVQTYIEQLQFLRLMELQGDSSKIAKAKEIAQATSDDMFYNPYNRDPQIASMLHSIGSDTPSVGVLGQYLELVSSGELKTYNNTFNFSNYASKITVPYLIMGGGADELAPPQVQQFLYQHVSSKDKTLDILGTSNGYSINYGHNDSLVSMRAAQEVYPRILNWLDQRTGVSSGSSTGSVPRSSTYNSSSGYQNPDDQDYGTTRSYRRNRSYRSGEYRDSYNDRNYGY